MSLWRSRRSSGEGREGSGEEILGRWQPLRPPTGRSLWRGEAARGGQHEGDEAR